MTDYVERFKRQQRALENFLALESENRFLAGQIACYADKTQDLENLNKALSEYEYEIVKKPRKHAQMVVHPGKVYT